MKKTTTIVLFTALILVVMAPAAFAADAAGERPEGLYGLGVALATGLCIAIAALGGGLGQGIAVKGAMEGIARNPGASGKIMTSMIIGLALIESLALYVLVVIFAKVG
jgi:F-type H+-transporting ATPase subunit c